MRKNRSLVKRNTALSSPNISLGTVVIIALVGFVIYLLWKNRSASASNYRNEEAWSVEYNKDGLPSRIVIHRDAKRS